MHSPPRLRPKGCAQALNLKKTTHFRHFFAPARREPMQKRDLFVFPKGALRRTKPNRARKARGRRKKTRAGNRPCVRGPRPGLRRKKRKKGGPARRPALPL